MRTKNVVIKNKKNLFGSGFGFSISSSARIFIFTIAFILWSLSSSGFTFVSAVVTVEIKCPVSAIAIWVVQGWYW